MLQKIGDNYNDDSNNSSNSNINSNTSNSKNGFSKPTSFLPFIPELANLPESSSYADLYSGLYFQLCPAHHDNSFSSDLAIISVDSKSVCRMQERRSQRHDAVVVSSRPLRTNELFEVVLVQTANGGERSIEAGF